MRIFTLLIFLAFLSLQAQVKLKFDKRFVECEDQWVAFEMSKDSSHVFGFIYIDEQAGLTFNMEGSFKLKVDDSYQVEKNKDANIKMRLSPNNVKVAILPASMYNDLQIDTVPEWLKYYKKDTNNIKRLYKWGFMYNGWNECTKALEFLLKAKSINPLYDGLAEEIAYSYNCISEYEMASEVLEEALKTDSTDAYLNKEYIYTLVKRNEIDLAIQHYKKSVKLNRTETFNAENCFQIINYFYRQKDQVNFKIWVKEFKKWPNKNELMAKHVKRMKKEMKKQ